MFSMFSKPKVQHGMRGGKTNTALKARQRSATASKSHDRLRQGRRDPHRRRRRPRCVHDGTRQQRASSMYRDLMD